MRTKEDRGRTEQENSYGGFRYRWNYDEYQKSLQRKRRKAAGRGMRAFGLTVAFVFCVCFASLFLVLLSAWKGTDRIRAELLQLTGFSSSEYAPDNADVADKGTIAEDSTENDSGNRSSSVSVTLINNEQETDVPELSVQEIARRCIPQTVSILGRSSQDSMDTESVGSGFFLTEDGYLATCNHVVAGYNFCQVVLNDGTVMEARIVASDTLSDTALLKIDTDSASPVLFGDDSQLEVGDTVVTIGTPVSLDFACTVTTGCISGLNRVVTVTDSDSNPVSALSLIQTTAVVNPGNSGGPLINSQGEVIGIISMKLTEHSCDGIALAIPLDSVSGFLLGNIDEDRSRNEQGQALPAAESAAVSEYESGLGFTVKQVTREESILYRIPAGFLVVSVMPDSAASSAGIQPNDILLSADGIDLTELDIFSSWESGLATGDGTEVTVYRRGQEEVLSLTVLPPSDNAGAVTEDGTNIPQN